MKSSLTKALIFALLFVLAISVFASCDIVFPEIESSDQTNTTESDTESNTESNADSNELQNFNYLEADIGQYFILPSSPYLKNTVTLGTEYVVTDKMVDE